MFRRFNSYLHKNWTPVTFSVLLFLTLFPLIFDDLYYNITITKYKTYVILSCGILLFALSETFLKKKKLHISPTDKVYLYFLGVCTISCLGSDWEKESFTGSSGKYVGLLFLLLSFGIYYGVSRYFRINRIITLSFPLILILTTTLSLSQFFGHDPFGFYKDMAVGTDIMYLSTFGHIDVYAAFLCVYFPFCLYYAIFESSTWFILYLTGAVAGILGILCCNSDSSYLGLCVSLAVLFCLSLKSIRTGQRFLIVSVVLYLSLLFFRLLLKSGEHRELSKITSFLLSDLMMIIFAAVLLLFGLFLLWCRHQNGMLPAGAFKVSAIFFISLICLIFATFIWFSVFDRNTDLDWLTNYLRFHDHWGSDRGYVWKWCFQLFTTGTLWFQIFGGGPDTTTLLLERTYHDEMYQTLGVYYASAHNEYLNYLVTIGLAGLIFYLILLGRSVISAYGKINKDPFYGGVFIALLSYATMAFVNISQPITMPFVFLLIAFANVEEAEN